MKLQLELALILLALMLTTQLSQHTREKDRTVENEQEEDEEVDIYNCVTVTRFYYGAAGSDDLLSRFMHWGCALFWCSCL